MDGSPSNTPPHGGRVREHFACFDGLRAIAALCIFVLHARDFSQFVDHLTAQRYIAQLHIGVTIFFVLSGFLLYYPFASAHFGGPSAPATATYLRRRAFRIFPAYWLVLAVTMFLSQVHYNGFDVLVHSLLLQIYRKGYMWGPVAHAWSLSAEISFYIFLPVFAWAISKRRRSGRQQLRIEMAALCCMFLFAFLLHYYFGNRKVWAYLQSSLPAQLDWFALGMFLAVGKAWYGNRKQSRFMAHPLFPILCWIVSAGAFWMVSTQLRLPTFAYGWILKPWQDVGQRFLYGLSAVALVAPAVFGPQHAGPIRWLLQTWPLRKLGMISYGFFLWHLLFIDMFRQDLLAAFCATLLTAAASYYIIEKPLLGRGARSAENRMAAP